MFDLNNNILNWKQNLKFNDSFTNENIDELENHLAEQIEYLRKSGLNDEEAFWVAQKRIGCINTLSNEFEKLNIWEGIKKRLFWMIIGFIALGIITHIINIINSLSYAVCIYFDINLLTWTYVIYALQISAIVLMFSFVAWLFTEKSKFFFNKVNFHFNEGSFLKYFSFSSVIIFISIIFMSIYGLNWLSVWRKYYVQTEIYREHITLISQFNYASWIISIIMVFIVFFFGYKNLKKENSNLHAA
ncbi:MAG: permease prefix domain 1-containing protein [Ignavibacteria bacterium]